MSADDRQSIGLIRATPEQRRALRVAAANDDMGSVASWLLCLAEIVIASGLRLDEVRERLAKS